MHLYLIPMVFMLLGLVMYTVLAGADFGAGLWELTAGRGSKAMSIREHARAIGPVWEANHVWLIFVVTVAWTSYPAAFGSIASTLCVPLFIAAVGIILRGASYAFRSGAQSPSEVRLIDIAFACSSLLTPFALGTVVGAIASSRVPVGNAAGDLITSWLNPTSIMIGALAVATGGYLAAVYLAADAVRIGDTGLAGAFRARALIAGVIAGGLAFGGLAVLHSDAHRIYHQLVSGRALPALIVSVVAGVAAVGLVWAGRYELARYVAGAAAATIVAGWALAQAPTLLPGLTVARAAAPRDTLVLVIVAVLAGGAILFPSLALLFRLVLRGSFDPTAPPAPTDVHHRTAAVATVGSGLSARAAVGCLIAGLGLLNVSDAPWAHAIGVACLFGFVGLGFAAVRPAELAGGPSGG